MNYYRQNSFFSLPLVTKNLIIINVMVFVLARYIIPDKIMFDKYLDLFYFTNPYFKPHQLITHMFMHADLFHLLFNMLGLYMFGATLENLWGAKRFINFYLVCGLGAALIQMGFDYLLNSQSMLLGASGAIYGLLGAYAVLFPNTYLMIYFAIPVKVKYVAMIIVAGTLFYGYTRLRTAGMYQGDAMTEGQNIAHFAHLGGLLVGIVIVWLWRKNGKSFY